jgi:dihydroorotate dehydrogenase electron transfer subunit
MFIISAWYKGEDEMYPKLAVNCSDINSPFCPCMLADTNHCISCSHLRGEPFCDCNWSGLCILYEKQWQSEGSGWRGDSNCERWDITTQVSRQETIAPGIQLLKFAVSEEMARELNKTGSFVFMRRPSDPLYFHFPVGIMKIEGTAVQVVIEAAGPKSIRILESPDNNILIRGPYYNGVLGQPWIEHITDGTILLVAGGMGQPPALPIAAKLLANGNKVIAVLAPGKVGKIFIDKELADLGAEVHGVDSMRRNGLGMLSQWLRGEKTPELVVSAGPDEQHYAVINAMNAAGLNLPMAVTNNATMCCGEGICGSCECEKNDGTKIKACKTQIDITQLCREQ